MEKEKTKSSLDAPACSSRWGWLNFLWVAPVAVFCSPIGIIGCVLAGSGLWVFALAGMILGICGIALLDEGDDYFLG